MPWLGKFRYLSDKSLYHLTDQMHYTQRETIGFVLHTALNSCSSRSCMFADEFVITSGLGGSSGWPISSERFPPRSFVSNHIAEKRRMVGKVLCWAHFMSQLLEVNKCVVSKVSPSSTPSSLPKSWTWCTFQSSNFLFGI